jgi:hypothetical protein
MIVADKYGVFPSLITPGLNWKIRMLWLRRLSSYRYYESEKLTGYSVTKILNTSVL